MVVWEIITIDIMREALVMMNLVPMRILLGIPPSSPFSMSGIEGQISSCVNKAQKTSAASNLMRSARQNFPGTKKDTVNG